LTHFTPRRTRELITPQTLEYGKGYSLVEVQAPYGYVLDSEPVYFDVEQENSEEESGITLIKVERSNMAQKGKITVSKSGEVFSRVSGTKGLYQPIFAVDNLEGAVYEITAAEDIITTDGTVRAEKGEVVDTLTTGEDGTAESKELYLGKYEVKEVTAPYGMVLNDEVHAVELVYGKYMDLEDTLQEVSLKQTTNDTIQTILPLAQDKDIQIHQNISTDTTISVNLNLWRKALSNIIGNAVRHSPCGEDVFISLQSYENRNALVIENTGASIPETDLPHMFTPFYRADKSRNKATGGSGLGLYIVKTILDLHGMTYCIKNTEQGVAFFLYLN